MTTVERERETATLQPPMEEDRLETMRTSESLIQRACRNRFGRWVLAGTAGVAATAGALQVFSPSTETQVGPLAVELSANAEGGLQILGEKLDGPLGRVGVEVEVQAPDLRDLPDGITEVGAIASELNNSPDKTLEDVLYERYADDITQAGWLLVGKGALLSFLVGGAVFAAANEKLKPTSERRMPARAFLIGGLGMTGLFAANVATSVTTFDKSSAEYEMDQVITPFLTDYFTDKTTQIVIDYKNISDEISKNLIRLDRYGETMSLSRGLDKDLVYFVTEADPHMRNPSQEIEAIDRVFGAVANVSLGDFINSNSVENEVLAGPTVFGEDFMGIQDITHCELWNPEDPIVCDKEGEAIPHYFVLGNHDVKSTGETLTGLGSRNVDMRIFRLPGVNAYFAAVADGCFLPDANCHSDKGDNAANALAGKLLKEKLQQLNVRPAAIFAAHSAAAKELDGMADTIYVGGLHRYDVVDLPKGSKAIVVGTSGQAFGRKAPEASVTVTGLDPLTGEQKDCRVVTWQGLNASAPAAMKPCAPTEGKL